MNKATTPTTAEQLSLFQYTRGREYAGNRFETSPRPERFKTYSGPYIRLKTFIHKGEEVPPSPGSLSGLELLKRILLPAFGVTAVKFHGHQSELLWSFPSAGGCYPVETYVVIRKMGEVEPGIYHYNAIYASLYRIADAQAAKRLDESLLAADSGADVYFIFSIVPWRTCWKYSHKGYRFGMVDAGHVLANFQLALRALGCRTAAYTRLRAGEIAEMLKLDSFEVPVAMIAAQAAPSANDHLQCGAARNGHLVESCAPMNEPQRDLDIHLFEWTPINDFQRRVNRTIRAPSSDWLMQLSLPEEWKLYDRLLPLLFERRSSAAFQRCELTSAELQTMLSFIDQLGLYAAFHLIINGVEGLQPGVYRYAQGKLDCLSAGDYRDDSAAICLGQSFIRDCSVLLVFTIDMSQIPEEEFSRYQQSSVDAGAMGQFLYLKAQEMGLGFSIIGGYYDDELRALLQLSPAHQIVYAGTWGRDDPNADTVRKLDRYVMNKPQS